MKQLLQQYAAYHHWANQKLNDCINNLSDDQLNREIASSYSSVYKTLLHMWDADSIWWQRLKLVEQVSVPSKEFKGSFIELMKGRVMQDEQWLEWVNNATEPQLTHVFAYRNTKKEEFKQPVYEMLIHLFNHATYHRGQLVTLLRQLGVEKIPATDFIVFARKK